MDRARTDRAGVEVGRAGDDLHAVGEPELGATSGSTGPTTEPVVRSGGSWRRLTPERRTSSGSYSRRSRWRLSVSQAPVIDACDAAAMPVNRIER